MSAFDFTNKTVVITAAGSGIGRASAKRFAACGAAVVVNDLNIEAAQRTVESISQNGGEAMVFGGDITQPETVDTLMALVMQTYGRLDVMFNNAGGAFPTPLMDIDTSEYRRLMALNLDATFMCTQAALKMMLPQGSGCILSTTSGAGLGAMPGLAVYGAAKAGVISLMRSVALEYGRQGIRANSISPGAIESPGLMAWLETLPGGAKAYNDAQPQGRLGRPDEIADAALYLASEQASFVNGAVLPVDGAVHSTLWNPLQNL